MARESYYWTRETQRGRKEAFWSNGELQLRFHGPSSHVNNCMRLVLEAYDGPTVPTGPPPKPSDLPPLHPGQTDLLTSLAEQQQREAAHV